MRYARVSVMWVNPLEGKGSWITESRSCCLLAYSRAQCTHLFRKVECGSESYERMLNQWKSVTGISVTGNPWNEKSLTSS